MKRAFIFSIIFHALLIFLLVRYDVEPEYPEEPEHGYVEVVVEEPQEEEEQTIEIYSEDEPESLLEKLDYKKFSKAQRSTCRRKSSTINYIPPRIRERNLQTALRDHIKEQIVYPEEAGAEGMSGKVRVEFKVVPTGKVIKVRILSSSGNGRLDAAARYMFINLHTGYKVIKRFRGERDYQVNIDYKNNNGKMEANVSPLRQVIRSGVSKPPQPVCQ